MKYLINISFPVFLIGLFTLLKDVHGYEFFISKCSNEELMCASIEPCYNKLKEFWAITKSTDFNCYQY